MRVSKFFTLRHIGMALGSMLFTALLVAQGPARSNPQSNPQQKQTSAMQQNPQAQKLEQEAPAKDYVKAHADLQNPKQLLGGPIHVQIQQTSGDAHIALPDQRRLDPRVFGPDDKPRAYAGTPIVYGVPTGLREQKGGEEVLAKPSPFGDKMMMIPGGTLKLEAVDATATDAAQSDDSVKMEATWKDKQGNTYAVRCCEKVVPHGIEYPTFGGVVTNHVIHGVTRIGTPLMPTEYAYLAFWGMGTVLKNGKVVDGPRVVHGMLTENVRPEHPKLAFDKDVDPSKLMFHVMVAPIKPDPAAEKFDQQPVKTGFKLPNGMELPFWHVMFNNIQVSAERTSTPSRRASR